MRKYFIIIMVFLYSGLAYAGVWHDVGKVTRVHSGHADGVIYFKTEIQVKTPTCNDALGYVFRDNSANTNRIYSLLLTAYVSKTPVHVYVVDACLLNIPQVNAVLFTD